MEPGSTISPAAWRAHAAAAAAGEPGYADPDTGFFVFTELALRAEGSCCGSGCRHCPFGNRPDHRPDDEVLPPMSTPDDRLRELGLELPQSPVSPPGHAPRPIEPLVVHDSLVFFSGIAPLDVTGVVGADLSVEKGFEAAGMFVDGDAPDRRRVRNAGRRRALDQGARLRAIGAGFRRPTHGRQRVLGPCHPGLRNRTWPLPPRSAIGCADLPRNIPIEVEAIVALCTR